MLSSRLGRPIHDSFYCIGSVWDRCHAQIWSWLVPDGTAQWINIWWYFSVFIIPSILIPNNTGWNTAHNRASTKFYRHKHSLLYHSVDLFCTYWSTEISNLDSSLHWSCSLTFSWGFLVLFSSTSPVSRKCLKDKLHKTPVCRVSRQKLFRKTAHLLLKSTLIFTRKSRSLEGKYKEIKTSAQHCSLAQH